jgi:hypothetical protein
MRRVLDCYLKKVLRTVDNPVKMKQEKNCLLIEEPVKVKDDKEDDERQAMKKPAKVKTVTWMLRGTTKAMSTMKTKSAKVVPRVTPTQSKWRIWDPGRSDTGGKRGFHSTHLSRTKFDPRPKGSSVPVHLKMWAREH